MHEISIYFFIDCLISPFYLQSKIFISMKLIIIIQQHPKLYFGLAIKKEKKKKRKEISIQWMFII